MVPRESGLEGSTVHVEFTSCCKTHPSLPFQSIFPITNLRRLRLWEEYFLAYDFTALAQHNRSHDIDSTPFGDSEVVGDAEDTWSSRGVVWMSDEQTHDCCGCQQKFSYLRRKVREGGGKGGVGGRRGELRKGTWVRGRGGKEGEVGR